jgi:nucleoporin GLE1
MQRLAAYKQSLLQETEAQYMAVQVKNRAQEQKLKTHWQERDKRQQQRIESVIKFEEDKRKAILEAERKAKEEEERRKRAEEEAKRLEEEARRLEEERKKKEELRQRLIKEKEEQEQQQRERAERETSEKEKSESSGRNTIGLTLTLEDWSQARDTLKVRKVLMLWYPTNRSTATEIWSFEDCQS